MADGTYVMGMDEGTTGARAIIFDEAGGIVAETARELTQYYPRFGWVEHDPVEILEARLETMRRTLEKAGISPLDVRTVGFTNQRETAMVWEKETGRPIYNAIVWASRRTVDVVEEWAAAGRWKDPDEVASLWREERAFEPRKSEERREQPYTGWREAVDLTRRWAKRVPVAE